MKETILIVDDEPDILSMLNDFFQYNGYNVITASCGGEALKKAENQPDLILLDINLPDMDGLEICSRIRSHISCPILFLTARMEDTDKVVGFGAGADDYIVKPFSMEELGARVAAHLRREHRKSTSSRIRFDDCMAIDYTERCLYRENVPIPLARKEFDILELLSRHPGQVFSKEQIYEHVWNYDCQGDPSVVAEHIRRIRAKLASAGLCPCIETVWGVGYKWLK